MNKHSVPLTVRSDKKKTYERNYDKVTHGSGRLFLFAGDQKVEHLNDDFYGEGIASENATPDHLFNIASKAKIGVFATQLGLISQYGGDFPKIPYLVKLNSKSHLVKTSQADPVSTQWYSVEDVVSFQKQSKLDIVGVGYTIYFGSEFENEMLTQAAQIVYQAHEQGLLSVIWAYPRGKALRQAQGELSEKDAHLIAGAAGAVGCLGADFVKVNYPTKQEGLSSAQGLVEAVKAAGKTQLICAGGSSMDTENFLQTLHDQIHISGAAGNATGRNIHQKPLDEAIKFCNEIFGITVENKTVEEVLKIFEL